MSQLTLRLCDGTAMVVPASLECATTYILLEQEEWFEKEIGFVRRWLKPGMNVIDIGANVGVYALTMARLVGPDGQVYAYEPGREARGFLEKGKAENGLSNLHVIAAAVSDTPREGHLVHAKSGEFHHLGDENSAGEAVAITSLDAEVAKHGWVSPDFVKIDAEGEDERVLKGGTNFFLENSPLVMFEIEGGKSANTNLRTEFPALGYKIYRSLTTEPVLVPFEAQEQFDGSEINLFAATRDRASMLAADGLLVQWVPDWVPDEDSRAQGLALLKQQPFVSGFGPLFEPGKPLDADYANALAGYAVWRNGELPISERYGALVAACRTLFDLCNRPGGATIARLSSLIRFAHEDGRRKLAGQLMESLLGALRKNNLVLNEPFWPVNPRFDAIAPGAALGDWFITGTMEQAERIGTYSGAIRVTGIDLDWLSKRPFASAEMVRRSVLQAVHAREAASIPERLQNAAPDHRNSDIWASGSVLTLQP